jgi:hypothetical protein
MIRAAGAIAIVLFAASFARGEDAELERLKKIAQEYDTIVVGKIKSVTIRQIDGPSPNRWAIVVGVSEILQGKELPHNEVTVFIHSPTLEFGISSTDLIGHDTCWALKRKGDDILARTAPFHLHAFKETDLDLLRQAIKEKPPAPPPPKPAPAAAPAKAPETPVKTPETPTPKAQ